MNPLVEIMKAFTSSWLWTVVFILTGAFMWLLNGALAKNLNRHQLDRLLDRRRYAVLYHELLEASLARVDRWLTPAIGPTDQAREAEGRRPWSWPLFDFSLRLALAYPLLSLIVAWGWLGTDGRLGSFVVLPAAGWRVRVGAVVALLSFFWLVYRRMRTSAKGKDWAIADFLLAFSVALGGAVAVALGGALNAVSALVVGLAAAFDGTFAIVAVGAYAVALSAADVGALTLALFLVLAFAFAVAVVVAIEEATQRTHCGIAAYASLILLLLAGLVTVVHYSSKIDGTGATLIIFLGLLPPLNAVFDFISVGLTRLLLRWGAVSPGSGALVWAFADVVGAIFFFALLGLALVTMVHWLNALAAAPLLDLGGLLSDIRADPGAYWWLYVTIFSTLLPTLLHLMLASFTFLLTIMPNGLTLFIRRQLPRIETDEVAKALVFWPLSTVGFLAIAAVAFGFYGLVTGLLAVFPYLGDWYLFLFERYAAWLGAPVVPVRPGWL